MKVVIVGTGNVAHVLGDTFIGAGHEIIEVAGRNKEQLNALANIFKCNKCDDIENLTPSADIYLIAVSDESIETVAQKIRLNEQVVVHTAGSVGIHVLQQCSANYGVVYPLQSFRKGLTQKPIIPVLLDGNNAATKETLLSFAKTWGEQLQFAADDERLKTHLAAVVVNNFVNHLFTITDQYCKEEKLNFSLLYPLIEETVHRIKSVSPSTVQTGPAIRHDFITLEKHLSILSNHHYLRELYKMLSSNIIDFYKKAERD